MNVIITRNSRTCQFADVELAADAVQCTARMRYESEDAVSFIPSIYRRDLFLTVRSEGVGR